MKHGILVWVTAVILAGMMLCGSCAAADGETTPEAWANEAGWTSFPLEVQKDELNDTWEEAAKSFGALLGLDGLDGSMLKSMMLQGYRYETHFDHLQIDGAQITVTSKDGQEVFSHEYKWVETIENALQGAAVYVFRTDDKKAGAFTYLCMTAPNERKSDTGEYTSFNLLHMEKDYRKAFEIEDGDSVQIPCMMIKQDTDMAGLQAAINDIFNSPGAFVTR